MRSYRESTVGHEPDQRPGRPTRPFNWVQWIGVALLVAGAVLLLAYLLGDAGLIPKLFGNLPQPFAFFPLIGLLLINSRRTPREPGTPADQLQRQRNRQAVLIALLACTVILGAAVAYEFLGAH